MNPLVPETDPNNAVFFAPSATPPPTDEEAQTSVAQPANGPPTTSETLHGFVTPQTGGGRTFNDAKFWYIAGSDCLVSAEPYVLNVDAGDPPTTGDFSATVTGLTPGTTYCYYVEGFYSAGGSLPDGKRRFDTPAGPPPKDDQIATLQADTVTTTSANLNGAWSAGTIGGDELSNAFFVYVAGAQTATDLRTVAGSTTTANIALVGTMQQFAQAVAGLSSATTYSYQAIGKRTLAPAWEKLGAVLTVTTNPTQDERIATSVSQPGAVPTTQEILHGAVAPQQAGGRTFNAATFYYNVGTSCTSASSVSAGDPPASGDFSTTATGLTPGNTYSYFVRGTYSSGTPTTQDGACLQFAVPVSNAAMDDQIVTLEESAVTMTGATLNGAWSAGTVNLDELQNAFFVYVAGTPTASDLRTVAGSTTTANIALTGTSQTFSQGITALTANSVYSFQAIGKRTTAPAWEKLGLVLTFSTLPDDGSPHAFTAQGTVACGPPAILTINGAWARGATQTLNTFAIFYALQGQPSPIDPTPNDLRDNVGVSNTGYVNKGSGASGSHSATVTYNNAAGTSYQFVAKNGTSGPEQLGIIVFVPPTECVSPQPIILLSTHDETSLELSISQAQCNGDQTSFSLDVNIKIGATLNNLNVTILNAATATPVMLIDDSQMFRLPTGVAVNGVFYFNRTFGPGPFMALAALDVSGAGVVDLFDSKAFNVPAGACGGTSGSGGVDNSALIKNHFKQTNSYLNLTRNGVNETEEHTDFIMGQNNKTVAHVDGAWSAVNGTHAHLLQFWASFNQTKTELRQVWGVANQTRSETRQSWGVVNQTRSELRLASAVLNETEDHADYLMGLSNSSKAEARAAWATLNVTHAEIRQAWATLNETEDHTDQVIGAMWARLNTTCQKGAVSPDDCEGIKTVLLTNGISSTAILAAIASHDANDTAAHNKIINHVDTFRASFNQTKSEIRQAWAATNETEDHADYLMGLSNSSKVEARQAWATLNLTRSHILGAWATLNETEEHTDLSLAYHNRTVNHADGVWASVNSTRQDVRSTWSAVNGTKAHVDSVWAAVNATHSHLLQFWGSFNQTKTEMRAAWGTLNETEDHTDYLMGLSNSSKVEARQAWATLNRTLLFLRMSWDTLNETEDHTDALLNTSRTESRAAWATLNQTRDFVLASWATLNFTRTHVDGAWGEVNRTHSDLRQFWGSFNQTKTEMRAAWGTLNETEDHTDYLMGLSNSSKVEARQAWATLNLTRSHLVGAWATLNETEEHTDLSLAYHNRTLAHVDGSWLTVNLTRQDVRSTWSAVNGTKAHVDSFWSSFNQTKGEGRQAWATLNETEDHTDIIIGPMYARLNTTCQKAAVSADDCEGIKGAALLGSSGTAAILAAIAAHDANDTAAHNKIINHVDTFRASFNQTKGEIRQAWATLNETEDHADYLMGLSNSSKVETRAAWGVSNQTRAFLSAAWATLNETEEHTDLSLAYHNRTVNHVDGVWASVNATGSGGGGSHVYTNALINATRLAVVGAWSAINQTHLAVSAVGTQVNETEEHADYIMGQVNVSRAETRIFWASFNQTKSELRQAWSVGNQTRAEHRQSWATGNETEEHTDLSLAYHNRTLAHVDGVWARTNLTCMTSCGGGGSGTGSTVYTNSLINLTRGDISKMFTVLNETEAHADAIIDNITARVTNVTQTYERFALKTNTTSGAVPPTVIIVPSSPYDGVFTAGESIWQIHATYTTALANPLASKVFTFKVDGFTVPSCTWTVSAVGPHAQTFEVDCKNAVYVTPGAHTLEITGVSTIADPVSNSHTSILLKQLDKVQMPVVVGLGSAQSGMGLFGMSASLPGLSDTDSTVVLLMVLLLIFALWHGFLFTAIGALANILRPFYFAFPFSFKALFIFMLLGLFLDLLVDWYLKRLKDKRDRSQRAMQQPQQQQG